MKDVGYFSHDSNAHRDYKMVKLRTKLGWGGYGLFWAIIENLRNETTYSLKTDYETIAYDLRSEPETICSIVEDFDLFVIEDGFFHSIRLDKCMAIKEEKSLKARESSLKRWGRNANASKTESKSKAIKGKEKKEKKDNKSLSSINKDFLNKLQDKHLDIDVHLQFEKFKNWISANGKTYKNYQSAFRNWLISGYCEKTDKIRLERQKSAEKQAKIKQNKYLEENSASQEDVQEILNSVSNKMRINR